MGCEGSKFEDEVRKLKSERTNLLKELDELKKSGRNANNNSVYEPGLSPTLQSNGSTMQRSSSGWRPKTKPGTGKPGGKREEEVLAWRNSRFADAAPPGTLDVGQCGDLLAGTTGKPTTFEEAVQSALNDGSSGFCVGTDGDFLPPGVPGASKPLDTAAVVRKAKALSASCPAVSLFTLPTPFSLLASSCMRKVAAAAAQPRSNEPISPSFSDGQESYRKYMPYETILHKELLTLPAYQQVCFKAIRYPSTGCYTPGHVITWHCPTSATKNPFAALKSLGGSTAEPTGTILIIQSLNGRLISKQSAAPDEAEVVFPTNTQFRTSHRVSSAVAALLTGEMGLDMDKVSLLAMCEVRLVVWRDVVTALDEVEAASVPRLIQLLELASDTAVEAGQYTLDMVTHEYVLGAPMTELPPRGPGGLTVVHLVSEEESMIGLLRLVTHRLKPTDIDELNADGRSPLNIALTHNNTAGAVHLLRKGATVASLGTMADAALAAAAAHTWTADNREIVERLLREVPPSDIEAVACSKLVLRAAASLGRKSLAQPLLQLVCKKAKNQQLKYLDCSGMLTAACSSPHVEKEFLEWLVVEAKAKDNGTAVSAAVKAGNYSIIKDLKALGIPLDAADADGRTALHTAVSSGNMEGTVALKNAGANLAVQDSHGWTLAHEAAYHDHVLLLKKLSEWKCSVDQPDSDGCTPLWWASDTGNNDVIKILVKCGANSKILDNTGTSALLIAAYNGHAATCKLLQSSGADYNKANNDGRTPAWLAAGVGSVDTLNVLKTLGATLDTPDSKGMTSAHAAAQEGWVDALRYLADHRVDMNRQDKHGLTPLHYAASKSRFDCIRYLCSLGANITIRGEDANLGSDCLPLHIAAAKGSFESEPDVLSLLIDATTINAECKCGAALDVAHMHNRYVTANKLREKGAETSKPMLTDEKMDELPDVVVREVVFRHPSTLPEKNAPGAVIKIMIDGDKFTYTLNGEERPSFRKIQFHKGSHGLALKFPDAGKNGRQVYLPVSGVREILAGLISMADQASIPNDLRSDFAELTAQGHIAPVRHTKRGLSDAEKAKREVKDPMFEAVVYPSDTSPYAFSRLKVVSQYRGGEEGASEYRWYRSNNGESWAPIKKDSPYPDETGGHYAYYATADELGCFLRCRAVPVRKDGKRGEPMQSAPIQLLWPPNFGIAIVDKLVESIAATKVTASIEEQVYPNVFLQLIERRIKVKTTDQIQQDPLLAGTIDEQHSIRCVLDPDSSCFTIRGMDRPVRIQVETRVERDFLVALIRVWCGCSDPDMCKKVLGGHFATMWAGGMRKIDELLRTDRIWNAFEEPLGGNLLHLGDELASTAAEEDRQAIVTLRKGFSSTQMRRPPTTSASQVRPTSPESTMYDARLPAGTSVSSFRAASSAAP